MLVGDAMQVMDKQQWRQLQQRERLTTGRLADDMESHGSKTNSSRQTWMEVEPHLPRVTIVVADMTIMKRRRHGSRSRRGPMVVVVLFAKEKV
ncbi:hypothetical protein Sjap_020083 [Stephania japonica]|uniref:Uncharacterized protein n=1 Tax=Stephania japonica TaxID=461633 RepID=A0AAP0F0S3_9MAGN